MTLQDIRKEIDAIDDELLALLARRIALAQDARALKPQAKDSERETEVHQHWTDQANALGLDPVHVKTVADAVIAASRSAQTP